MDLLLPAGNLLTLVPCQIQRLKATSPLSSIILTEGDLPSKQSKFWCISAAIWGCLLRGWWLFILMVGVILANVILSRSSDHITGQYYKYFLNWSFLKYLSSNLKFSISAIACPIENMTISESSLGLRRHCLNNKILPSDPSFWSQMFKLIKINKNTISRNNCCFLTTTPGP